MPEPVRALVQTEAREVRWCHERLVRWRHIRLAVDAWDQVARVASMRS